MKNKLIISTTDDVSSRLNFEHADFYDLSDIACGTPNRVDANQTAPQEQSDQGLHCLLRLFHSNNKGSTGVYFIFNETNMLLFQNYQQNVHLK